MRQNLVVFALVVLLAIIHRSNAVPTVTDSQDLKLSTPFGYHSLTEIAYTTTNRYLRTNSQSATKNAEERDITVTSVLSASAKAIRMKGKLNVMLMRGLSPERVLEKLNVVRMNDKNFNNFARYYAKYLAKYSGKKENLPATAEDVIVLPKLKEWLGQQLLPWQVKDRLKDLASTNVNRYLQLYLKDADNIIMLPRLQRWRDQKLDPSRFIYNLNEIGITDTTRYMDWYMRNGGDDIIKAKLQTWFDKRVAPQMIVQKLQKIGVTDTEKYATIYKDIIIKAKLQTWLDQRVFPQMIAQKLHKIGVTDIEKYARIYVDMWGMKQASLSTRIN